MYNRKPHISTDITATRLSLVQPGQRVRFVDFDAGANLRRRLLALGFIKGAEIVIIGNEGRGPMIVKLGESRLTIGRGMASKILVQ